jgi:hypothetical protein
MAEILSNPAEINSSLVYHPSSNLQSPFDLIGNFDWLRDNQRSILSEEIGTSSELTSFLQIDLGA